MTRSSTPCTAVVLKSARAESGTLDGLFERSFGRVLIGVAVAVTPPGQGDPGNRRPSRGSPSGTPESLVAPVCEPQAVSQDFEPRRKRRRVRRIA